VYSVLFQQGGGRHFPASRTQRPLGQADAPNIQQGLLTHLAMVLVIPVELTAVAVNQWQLGFDLQVVSTSRVLQSKVGGNVVFCTGGRLSHLLERHSQLWG
jgi:hypothetical protein